MNRVTHAWVLHTPERPNRLTADSPPHHPIPPLIQPIVRLRKPLPPALIPVPRPQRLRHGRSPRPDPRIHHTRIRLLRPQRHLSSDHQLRLRLTQPIRHIIVINQLPRLERPAPRPAVALIRGRWLIIDAVVSDEIAVAAVQVVEIRRRDDGAVAGADDPLSVGGAVVPCLKNHALCWEERGIDIHVRIEQNVFPVNDGAI